MGLYMLPQKPMSNFVQWFRCCVGVSGDSDDELPDRPDSPIEAVNDGIDHPTKADAAGRVSESGAAKKAEEGGVHFAGVNDDDEQEVEEEDEDGDGASAERTENEFGTQGQLVPFNSSRQLVATDDASSISSAPSVQEQVAIAYCELELEYDTKKCEVLVVLVCLSKIKQQILDSVKLEHFDLIKLKLALLPAKTKRSSGARSLAEVVNFGDRLKFPDVQPNQLCLLGLRIRAYRCQRHRRSTMIGETILPFLAIQFNGRVSVCVALDTRKTLEELDVMSQTGSQRSKTIRSFANNVFDTLENSVLPSSMTGAQSPVNPLLIDGPTRSSSRSLPSSGSRTPANGVYRRDLDSVSNIEGSSALALLDNDRRRSVMSGSVASSSVSVLTRKRRAGELQLGLKYLALTGRLNLIILKAANLTSSDLLSRSRMRDLAKQRKAGKLEEALEKESPNSLVEVQLTTLEGTLATSRTTVRKRESDPTYQEEFVYDVPTRTLDEVTITITIYDRRKGASAVLGWIAFGKQNSGVDEATHWADMRANRGQTVVRWHTLLK